MYVRVKKIGSKRYVYLVEGVSKDGRVRQKTLAYLGPVTRIAAGVPEETVKKISRKIGAVDWDRINSSIGKIPLEFEELQEMKRDMLPKGLVKRKRETGRGSRPRVEGELSALTLIARKGFNDMFRTMKDGTLVMR